MFVRCVWVWSYSGDEQSIVNSRTLTLGFVLFELPSLFVHIRRDSCLGFWGNCIVSQSNWLIEWVGEPDWSLYTAPFLHNPFLYHPWLNLKRQTTWELSASTLIKHFIHILHLNYAILCSSWCVFKSTILLLPQCWPVLTKCSGGFMWEGYWWKTFNLMKIKILLFMIRMSHHFHLHCCLRSLWGWPGWPDVMSEREIAEWGLTTIVYKDTNRRTAGLLKRKTWQWGWRHHHVVTESWSKECSKCTLWAPPETFSKFKHFDWLSQLPKIKRG